MDVRQGDDRIHRRLQVVERPDDDAQRIALEMHMLERFHRSDCNICRKQDGLKTGSALLDVPRAGGYIVDGEHFLVSSTHPCSHPVRGRSSSRPSAISWISEK